jgi:hypothetical protein
MTKTKYVFLKENVTFNGSIVEAGEVIELSEKSAQALINEDKAAEAIPDEETGKALEGAGSPENDETGNKHLTTSEDPEKTAGEELELITSALNAKYNRDPLAEEAKAVGVQFPYDAKKSEIIQAVIEAGKAEVLLAK